MKIFLTLLIFTLSSCAQLINGQIQPVVKKKENLYFTTCSGAVEDMASCNRKAMGTCVNGYNTLEKFEDTNGPIRSLTFECKK